MLRPRGLQNRDDKVIVFLYFYFYFVFLWAWVDLRYSSIRGDKVQAQPLPLFIDIHRPPSYLCHDADSSTLSSWSESEQPSHAPHRHPLAYLKHREDDGTHALFFFNLWHPPRKGHCSACQCHMQQNARTAFAVRPFQFHHCLIHHPVRPSRPVSSGPETMILSDLLTCR